MFRRSNSREPDHYSAKYIYFTSIPHDDNDFSFIKLIDDEQYQSLINDFVKKVKDKNIKVKYNKHKVIKRKRKFSLSERVFISSYKKIIIIDYTLNLKYNAIFIKNFKKEEHY